MFGLRLPTRQYRYSSVSRFRKYGAYLHISSFLRKSVCPIRSRDGSVFWKEPRYVPRRFSSSLRRPFLRLSRLESQTTLSNYSTRRCARRRVVHDHARGLRGQPAEDQLVSLGPFERASAKSSIFGHTSLESIFSQDGLSRERSRRARFSALSRYMGPRVSAKTLYQNLHTGIPKSIVSDSESVRRRDASVRVRRHGLSPSNFESRGRRSQTRAIKSSQTIRTVLFFPKHHRSSKSDWKRPRYESKKTKTQIDTLVGRWSSVGIVSFRKRRCSVKQHREEADAKKGDHVRKMSKVRERKKGPRQKETKGDSGTGTATVASRYASLSRMLTKPGPRVSREKPPSLSLFFKTYDRKSHIHK